MSSTIYRYDEAPRSTFSKITCWIGNGFAIFGGLALVAFIVDMVFFNNAGLISLLIWLWEVTN